MTNATRAQVLQHLETLEADPAVLEALRASTPVGPEVEAATDAALDLVLLPPIRVDRATHAALQEAARASGKVLQAVVRERLAPAEPVAWREHVEQRIRGWRQRTMNRSGDRLALDDMMGQDSIDDLIDYVCDQWAEPVARGAAPT